MVNYQEGTLDAVFAALSDRTRREVIAALAGGTRAVSELAEPFDMSLPAFIKHLRILEDARLIVREKRGRTVHCSISPAGIQPASDWITRQRAFWEPRLDALAHYLEHKEDSLWKPSRSAPRSSSSDKSARHPRKSGKHGPRPRR